jgi:hypothetical protein
MKRIILKQVSPETSSSSSFPVFVRFYNSERNLLAYKDGAVPFFLKTYEFPNNEFITQVNSNFIENRRVSRDFLFNNFYVYRITNFGNQALSPFFEDFFPLPFNQLGYKIAQRDVMIIKNYTSKEAFILVPKTRVTLEGQLSPDFRLNIVLEFKDQINTAENKITIDRENNLFRFNLKGTGINSIDDINIYANGQQLRNSEYFISFIRESFPSNNEDNTYIAKQENYFQDLITNSSQDKILADIDITLNENLKTNSIQISSKQHDADYYYRNYETLQSPNFGAIFCRCFVGDVFRQGANGFMTQLIPGIDFYIDNTVVGVGRIIILGATSNDIFEVFIEKNRKQKLIIPFQTTSSYTNGFSIKSALYHNNIANWDVDLNNTNITIFEDGLLKGFSFIGQTSYSEYSFVANKRYSYKLDDISFTTNSTSFPSVNSNVTYLTSGQAFDTFNINTIVSDPFLNTFGESKPLGIDYSVQEAFLYYQNLNFKTDILEPRILQNNTSGATKYTINDVADPYLETAFEDIKDDLLDVQESDLSNLLRENTKVQQIENSVMLLKKNFKNIYNNSTLTLNNLQNNTKITSPDFLFLVIKDKSGKFDITYYLDNVIVKKEYSCEITDSVYISVPYFEFDSFRITSTFNSESVVDGQYSIFK